MKYKSILFFICTTLLINISNINSAPYIPASGDEILLLLDKTSPRSLFNDINSRLQKNKQIPSKLIDILHETIEYGKLTSEPRYIGFVSSYVDNYLKSNNNNTAFTILKANILQHDHQFNKAVKLLNTVIKSRPRNARALLLRASILQVQANYSAARKDCYSLLGKTSHLVMLSCIAQIDGLTKNTEKNYTTLKTIIKSSSKHSPTELSWSYDILAQLAMQLGDNEMAKQHLKEALTIAPNNSSLLNAYADSLISNNEYKKVIKLLKYKSQNFTILLRLAIAEKFSLTTTLYKNKFIIRLNKMQELSDLTHQREISAFYLYVENNATKALEYAKRNWNIQKELYDAELLLLCALLNNDVNASKPVIDWYTKNSIYDVRLNKIINSIKKIDSSLWTENSLMNQPSTQQS